MGWSLKEWNRQFADKAFPPMSQDEIDNAIKYLRDKCYPMPDDCPEAQCPKYRPACYLGVCQIAVGMCGDF